MLYRHKKVLVEFKSYPHPRYQDDAMKDIRELATLLKDGGTGGASFLECLGVLPEPSQLRAQLFFIRQRTSS
jgi:hypothetical protein